MSKGKRLGALGVLLLVSCGGGAASGSGAESAKGSQDEPAAAASEEPAAEAQAGESQAEGPPAQKEADASEAATGTLEGEDLKSVLQLVLGDPELLDNLQLKKPGRSPLKISGPGLPDKLNVVVGSHDVKVVGEPKSSKEPVLVFTRIERSGDQAKVHYRFAVEGLEGRASCVLKKGNWELAANRVVTK